jgi:small-conductance mechanosensitive channel
MLALTAIGVVVIVMALPISDAKRGQLLSLIGILISAAIALSATTFLGNAMAGVMLRSVRNFRIGDFIRCADQFGRVTERGLLHTEIQTEDRDLVTLPNLFLVTNPVTIVRSSGTVVSATVSLGYDVPRARIEGALLRAAENAGLSDPFVQVLELGDFSVVYRAAGLLTEVKQLVTARSRLRAAVMDALHGDGIEIVSPSFMNQRVLDPERMVVPDRIETPGQEAREGPAPESVVFDKADEAESLENLRTTLEKVVQEAARLEGRRTELPDGDEREKADRRLERLEVRRRVLEETIASRESSQED